MSTEPHVGPISGWYAHAAWREREVDVHDADCTFSPRISEYSHLLQRSSGPTAMYERGVEFLQERESRRQAEQAGQQPAAASIGDEVFGLTHQHSAVILRGDLDRWRAEGNGEQGRRCAL